MNVQTESTQQQSTREKKSKGHLLFLLNIINYFYIFCVILIQTFRPERVCKKSCTCRAAKNVRKRKQVMPPILFYGEKA
jgi:hypothetical protein